MTDAPDTSASETPPAAGTTRSRRVVGVGLILLFAIGMCVFLAPFAFPTPPPIVTRFQATKLFSPTGDGRREVARVAVRLSEASIVDIEIRDRDDRRVKGLIAEERPRGIASVAWDGTDDQARPAPDGRYKIVLRARSARKAANGRYKRWNKSRQVILDRQAPPLGTLSVQSAAIAGAGEGECRVAATALDRGSLGVEVLPAAGEPAIARFGPRTVTAGQTSLWNWDGKRADGTPAAPGLYVVRAFLADVSGNRSEQSATCWAGHLLGTLVPPRPKLGTRVRVQLRQLDGTPLPGSTRVALATFRRVGDPGTASTVLGAGVGPTAAGPVGSARLQLPRKVPAADLWVVATTDTGRALIPLRP